MKPTDPQAHQDDPSAVFQQAVSLHRSGNLAEAIRLYRHLLDKFPRNPQTVFALGTAECQAGNASDGIKLLDESLLTFPNNAAAYRNKGNALRSLGRLGEAQDCYRRAIVLNPSYLDAHLGLGDALYDLGRLAEALISYDNALRLAPDTAEIHFQRGNVLRRLGRPDEALASYAQAAQFRPDLWKAHSNCGSLLCDLGRTDEGLLSLERAIKLMPTSPELHTNRGMVLRSLKRFEEALQAFDTAIQARPDYPEAHFQKAELLLLIGDYKRGWDLYEWRWKTGLRKAQAIYERYPLWTGERPVADRSILIRPEVGFGDFIMFSRFAPVVSALGATVILHTPRPLVPLLTGMGEGVMVIDESEPPPRVDWQCPIMSLPRALAITLESVPGNVPYLSVAEERQKQWRRRLGRKDKFRVGLAWAGHGNRDIDSSVFRNRSISVRLLEPLLELPVEIHSLQKEMSQDDAALVARLDRIAVHSDELADFADTAALIEEMDLIISIDTSAAHLAGALGRPLWVMLPYAVDYRWAAEGEKTPWYPTATLFRQPNAGNWESVVRMVTDELRELLTAPHPAAASPDATATGTSADMQRAARAGGESNTPD